jgi:LAS superfamily LD-carboxypeptidase LdcB
MKPNWPVRDIRWCEHIKNKKPSQITPDMVVAVSAGGKLERCAAAAFEEMATAAKTDGIILKATSAGDTLRSIAQQTAGFIQRYQEAPIAGASTKTWNGKKYYLKPGMAMLATPYDDPANAKARGSRHLYGIAIDIAGTNGNSPTLKWLLANEVRFGFSHEVLGDANGKGAESWHIRYTGVRV